MQNAVLEKDKTARISGSDHYTLKLISLNTGISVKQLLSTAVPLLAKQYPQFKPQQQSSYGIFPPEPALEG